MELSFGTSGSQQSWNFSRVTHSQWFIPQGSLGLRRPKYLKISSEGGVLIHSINHTWRRQVSKPLLEPRLSRLHELPRDLRLSPILRQEAQCCIIPSFLVADSIEKSNNYSKLLNAALIMSLTGKAVLKLDSGGGSSVGSLHKRSAVRFTSVKLMNTLSTNCT